MDNDRGFQRKFRNLVLGWLIPDWAKDSYVECVSHNFERTSPGFFWLRIRESGRVSKLLGQGSKASGSQGFQQVRNGFDERSR